MNRTLKNVVVCSLASVFAATAVAATATWWHGQTQFSRNQRIVTAAIAENGMVTGETCKNWARRIVNQASRNEVTIPATAANNYQWLPSPDVYAPQMCLPIQNAAVGSVIQMLYTQSNGTTQPHTAILKSRTSTGMEWIDCNWVAAGKVGVHSMSYPQFYAGVGNRYTVYAVR